MPGYQPAQYQGSYAGGGGPSSSPGPYRPAPYTGSPMSFFGGARAMANPAMADLASRYGGGVDMMGLERAQQAGSMNELMGSGMNQEEALKAWALRQNPSGSFAYNPKVNARSGDAYDPETYARSVSSTGPGGWGMVPMSSGVDYGFFGDRLGAPQDPNSNYGTFGQGRERLWMGPTQDEQGIENPGRGENLSRGAAWAGDWLSRLLLGQSAGLGAANQERIASNERDRYTGGPNPFYGSTQYYDFSRPNG